MKTLSGTVSIDHDHQGHSEYCECPPQIWIRGDDGELYSLSHALAEGDRVTVLKHKAHNEGVTLYERHIDISPIRPFYVTVLEFPPETHVSMDVNPNPRTRITLFDVRIEDIYQYIEEREEQYEPDAGDLVEKV